MNYKHIKQFALLVALILAFVGSQFVSAINPYYLQVILFIGINITLATSLNLINGFTGQFSLGHAGFMAIGAYAAADLTRNVGPKLIPLLGGQTWIVFPLALLIGGLMAAVAGILVGAPSLRLKGDYLAIVTLGFGQIIAVVFRNIEPLGGALGLNGIPAYTNLFWVFAAAALAIYTVTTIVN